MWAGEQVVKEVGNEFQLIRMEITNGRSKKTVGT